MKRFRSIALVTGASLMGAVLIVSGCGSSGGTSSSGAGTSKNATGSSGKITLTLMDWYTSTSDAEMKKMISEYEKQNPNVTIKRVVVPGNSYLQKVLQEATANALPDILMLDNPMVPDVASTGVLEDFSKIGKVDTSNFAKGSLSEGMYNDKLYGLPIENNTIGLFYNKTMFKQAGISHPPTTWSELVADAKKLTHGSVYGFAFSGHSGIGNVAWQTEPFLWTAGGDLAKHIDSSGSKKTLQLLQQMVKDGSMPQAVVNWDQQDVQNQFQEGKVAMVINGPWIVPSLKQIKNLDYGIATIPVPKAGDKVVGPLGGEVWTIPKHDAATEAAALKFITWFTDTKQSQIEWNTANQTVPPYTPAVDAVVSKFPFLKTFATEVQTARSRTADLGSNYPKAVDIWGNAVQSVITGKSSIDQALAAAKSATDQMLSSQ
ncbi:MAG: sugar ABC transporter substrate-binding protein [Alicyclobacillus sp.]|nr:sugar ABC transporter substrate-binding protein [Alicyclobacillus sp.]